VPIIEKLYAQGADAGRPQVETVPREPVEVVWPDFFLIGDRDPTLVP
jgi:hypothetical protein